MAWFFTKRERGKERWKNKILNDYLNVFVYVKGEMNH